MPDPYLFKNLPFFMSFMGGYLFGSVPFGLVLTRLAGLGDLRLMGSGNIGATNVLRTGRKDLAVLTLLFDAGKAGLAAGLAWWLWGYEAGLVAGGAAFLGHCWPVWLKFRGGKGVATFFGILFMTGPVVGLVCSTVWIFTVFLTRYVSLASLTAAITAPMTARLSGNMPLMFLTLILFFVIFWRHRGNIARLMRAEEDKIGYKRKENL